MVKRIKKKKSGCLRRNGSEGIVDIMETKRTTAARPKDWGFTPGYQMVGGG
jgi:hypothetical protein